MAGAAEPGEVVPLPDGVRGVVAAVVAGAALPAAFSRRARLPMLTPLDRRRLLRHARCAIAARLDERPLDPLPAPGALAEPAAVFVTIRLDDRLRGCIGTVEDDEPLAAVVARCAADAATRDPRFPPLPREALSEVRLEISVLTPFRRVDDPAETEVGRHGVMVEQGPHRGLLLPQVAGEWGWDRDTLLSQACVKAGLSADAWRTGAAVHTFEAQVFAEECPPRC